MLFGCLTLCLNACGEKNKIPSSSAETKTQEQKPQDAKTDTDADADTPKNCPIGKGGANCDECLPGYFGQDCEPCTCTEYGSCNDGKEGNGKCFSCHDGYWGENCQNECNCDEEDENQICHDGPEGFGCICSNNKVGNNCDIDITCKHGELDVNNGQCVSCNSGWAGENCDKCASGFWGSDCNQKTTCLHGEANEGISGNGRCLSCQDGYWGENCENLKTCVNGTPSLGINGNGKCTACNSNFDGENCDRCKNSLMTGPNCDQEILCRHGTLDTQTGHCLSNSCTSGFTGLDCNECSNPNMTGVNCDISITCKHGTVDPQNGHCISGSCSSHFTGEDCDKCQNNKLGRNCDIDTVVIDGQTWSARNMDTIIGNDGTSLTCYANPAEPDFVKNYGCLYTFDDAQKVCPTGWHLPEKEELDENTGLLKAVGGNNAKGAENLRVTTWNSGTNIYNFSALPAGQYYSGNYSNFGSYASFWSSTVGNNGYYHYHLRIDDNYAGMSGNDKDYGYSVRCIKNNN